MAAMTLDAFISLLRLKHGQYSVVHVMSSAEVCRHGYQLFDVLMEELSSIRAKVS